MAEQGPKLQQSAEPLEPFIGWVAGVLALFVAAFVVFGRADGDGAETLLSSVGAVLIAALLPAFIILVGRLWREGDYAKLDEEWATFVGMLRGNSRGLSRREVVESLIAVYGDAMSVSGRLWIYVVGLMGLTGLLFWRIVMSLAADGTFTPKEAKLLVVLFALSSLALLNLLWPDKDERAARFDLPGLIAGQL